MKKKIIILISILTLIATALTGCTDSNTSKPEKSAVCFVIANTANSQGLNFNSPLVQDTIYATIRNYGYISVVNADGDSSVVAANSFDIDEKYKSASKDKLDMEARSKATNFIMGMQNVIADDPEVDYLEALRLAVRTLSPLEGYDSKSIIVIGTGVATSGNNLNFSNNLLSADTDVLINMLKDKSEIIDFSNIVLYWQQMADVAAPQTALNSKQKAKLQDIYASLVEAGGGKFVYNDIIANPVDTSIEYPSVTPVKLPLDTPISFTPETIETSSLAEPWILSEEMVSFVGDESEYLNPDEAVNSLRPIAEYLNKNSFKIMLCGTTAGDENNDYCINLSQKRAEKVKQTLVELGVNENDIICKGLGSNSPWHITGIPTSDKASSVNRSVVLIDSTSETALSILEKTNS